MAEKPKLDEPTRAWLHGHLSDREFGEMLINQAERNDLREAARAWVAERISDREMIAIILAC